MDQDGVVLKWKDVTDRNIDHNIFHDYIGSSGNAAVQPLHANGSVSVHDNVLWNVGKYHMGSGSGNIINPSDKNVKDWVPKDMDMFLSA